MTKPDITGERLVALFFLGVLVFNPPLLSIFNSGSKVAGLPLLYFYLFGAWTALIALMALTITRAMADEDKVDTKKTSDESRAPPRGPGELS